MWIPYSLHTRFLENGFYDKYDGGILDFIGKRNPDTISMLQKPITGNKPVSKFPDF